MSEEHEKPDNCLAGFACPGCGQWDEFLVEGFAPVIGDLWWDRLSDDGTDNDPGGDFEFDDDNRCKCPKCGWQGTVGEARSEEAEA